jgi:hypothetical protein
VRERRSHSVSTWIALGHFIEFLLTHVSIIHAKLIQARTTALVIAAARKANSCIGWLSIMVAFR